MLFVILFIGTPRTGFVLMAVDSPGKEFALFNGMPLYWRANVCQAAAQFPA
jgi:hypothetical protein